MQMPCNYKNSGYDRHYLNNKTDSLFNKRLDEISYNYFVFEFTQSYGATYKDFNSKVHSIFLVDSFLKNRSLKRDFVIKLAQAKEKNTWTKTQYDPSLPAFLIAGRLMVENTDEVKEFLKRYESETR